MESEHFDNYFVKKRKKEKVSSGKKFGVFSARYSNFTFNRKFNSKMNKIRVFFFSNIRALLSIFKKVQGGHLPSSSHIRCSIKKGVLKNFSKFTGKHHL